MYFHDGAKLERRRAAWRKAQRKKLRGRADRGWSMHEIAVMKALRDEFYLAVERGVKMSDMCKRIGWNAGGRADTSRLSRELGLKLSPYEARYVGVRYERAMELARAIGVEPVDVGL